MHWAREVRSGACRDVLFACEAEPRVILFMLADGEHGSALGGEAFSVNLTEATCQDCKAAAIHELEGR